MSIGLIVRAAVLVEESDRELTGRYELRPDPPAPPPLTFWDGWWQGRREAAEDRRPDREKAAENALDEQADDELPTHASMARAAWRWLTDLVAHWWSDRRKISINDWDGEAPPGEPVSAGGIWSTYLYRGKFSHRLTRLVPVAFIYFLLAKTIVALFGAVQPIRGDLVVSTDRWILMGSIFAMIALTFFVVDASRLCERFLERLSFHPTRWPRRRSDRSRRGGHWCRSRMLATSSTPS